MTSVGSRIEKLLAEVRAECVPHYPPDARLLRALDDIEAVAHAGDELAREIHAIAARQSDSLLAALERWDALAGRVGEEYVIR